jgi:pectate lyase
MKFAVALGLLAGFAAAKPTPTVDEHLDARTLEKRAAITDACTVGFCTQNGG